jgi:hypothetical protein
MSELACDEMRAIAAELALGLVTGTERAAALAHLASCTACSDEVDQLSSVADRLLLLAPLAEPAAGFETAVLARIGDTSNAGTGLARIRRRLPLGVAAAVLVVSLLLVADLLFASGQGQRVASAPMATASGQVVGEAYVHDGSPGWVFVTLPGWDAWSGDWAQSYVLEVTLRNGRKVSLGELALDRGRGGWGTNLAVASADVRTVSVVDGDGHLRCSATFT